MLRSPNCYETWNQVATDTIEHSTKCFENQFALKAYRPIQRLSGSVKELGLMTLVIKTQKEGKHMVFKKRFLIKNTLQVLNLDTCPATSLGRDGCNLPVHTENDHVCPETSWSVS